MNDASDIVLLESNMHKVTFANVPLRVFNLDGQGAGEFCLEMDALHLIPRPHNLVIFYDINHTQVAIRTVGGQKQCTSSKHIAASCTHRCWSVLLLNMMVKNGELAGWWACASTPRTIPE
jgi:hypothetical protein